MKSFLKILIIVFLVLFIFSDVQAMGERQKTKNFINKESSDFTLYDMDGKEVSLSDYKDKNNVMLFFWATWCHFCRKEIVYLNDKHQELKEKGIVVLAIDVNEDARSVKNFLSAKPIKYRILFDEDAEVAFSYGLIGVPTYVLVDKKGVVKFIGNNFPEDYQELISD